MELADAPPFPPAKGTRLLLERITFYKGESIREEPQQGVVTHTGPLGFIIDLGFGDEYPVGSCDYPVEISSSYWIRYKRIVEPSEEE